MKRSREERRHDAAICGGPHACGICAAQVESVRVAAEEMAAIARRRNRKLGRPADLRRAGGAR